MTELEWVNAVLGIVQSGGIIALLLYNQQLGLKGEVVPKSVVSAIVAASVASTIDELEERGYLKHTPHAGD